MTSYSGDRNSWTSIWRLKQSDFQATSEAVAKIMGQQKDVKRTEPTKFKWIVGGRDNTHWLLFLERLGDQELAVRFERVKQ